MVEDMLTLEREARDAGRGIWRYLIYRIRSAAKSKKHLDSFQLAEGRILDAANIRGRIHLNFGEDWRSNLTATVFPEDRRRFQDIALNLLSLQGRLVRMRECLHRHNGPMIDVTHLEHIEILDE